MIVAANAQLVAADAGRCGGDLHEILFADDGRERYLARSSIKITSDQSHAVRAIHSQSCSTKRLQCGCNGMLLRA